MQQVVWLLPPQKSHRLIIPFVVCCLKIISLFLSLVSFKICPDKKTKSCPKNKKAAKKLTVSSKTTQLPEIKTSTRTDISSRTKQLTEALILKDILETSEGRYAFIDENKVTYVVQEGEWLEKVFVKTIYNNSVELQEIDGDTTIILTLQP